MKTKIVLWGTNEKEEKVLLAIELIEDVNLIQVHAFGEELATEEFYNQMMNLWREGTSVPFPEGHKVYERKLSMTDDILPENLRTKRTDLLARAKTEWHFVILSSKLYQNYQDELEDIRTRINALDTYDRNIWDEVKSFWEKVQNQSFEKNLFREHSTNLRNQTDELFNSLKVMRRSLNSELDKSSKLIFENIGEKIAKIEEKIEKGLGLHPIFNELKEIQKEFKSSELISRHRNELFKRIDNAFKKAKEKRSGPDQDSNNGTSRYQHRLDGLTSAISRMEQTIKRDRQDLKFQQSRIEAADGQLEVQLRQAKLAMLEERIASKQVKLDDMLKTKADIEARIEKDKEREVRRKEQQAVNQQIKAKEEEIKAKIAKDIQSKNIELEDKKEKLTKASEAVKEEKASRFNKVKASLAGAAVAIKKEAEEIAQDIQETIKEIDPESLLASARDKAENMVDDLAEGAATIIENIKDKIDDITERISEEE